MDIPSVPKWYGVVKLKQAFDEVKTIYFDESGYTGSDLINDDIPYFTCAAVAISEDKAKELIQHIRNDYNLKQGFELKFKNIKKYPKVMLHLIEQLKDIASVVCFNQKYALCAKFFEYIFEPCISDIGTLFYAAGFHHFITYTLYNVFFGADTPPSNLLSDFSELMKNRPKNKITPEEFLKKYSYNPKSIDLSSFERLVRVFMTKNHEAILEELNFMNGDEPIDRFKMDLSLTSLFYICAEMNNRYKQIKIVYDESKSIEAQKDCLLDLTGREIFIPNFNHFADREKERLNILPEIKSANSRDCYGVQVADLIAGITNHAYKENDLSLKHELIKNKILTCVVAPEIINYSVIDIFYQIYVKVLFEMTNNSFNNMPLVDDNVTEILSYLIYLCRYTAYYPSKRIKF
ncbi:DUF3800 domain-containing protein [bacterium]|nr:DUF3800 domain-containing protein [bacterium]